MGSQEVKTRFPQFMIIVGTNGTGKTTLLKKLVINELKRENGRVLILTPDDTEWLNIEEVHPSYPERMTRYSGSRKMIVTRSNANTMLENVRKYFKGGLLVFDDCRAYFKAGTSAILEEIFIRRRQAMLDLCAVGHGFSKIPPAFFAYATHIAMFKTTDPVTIRKDRFENIDKWQSVQQRVNKEAENNFHYFQIHKI